MTRKKLSLDDLRIESFTTGADSGAQALTTTLSDTGDTAEPRCNSVQTCVC